MTGSVFSNGQIRQNITLPVNTESPDRGGKWDFVGTYYFAGEPGEYFRLVSSGGSYARVADVKFEKNEAYVPLPVIDSAPVVLESAPYQAETKKAMYYDVFASGTGSGQIQLLHNGAAVMTQNIAFTSPEQHAFAGTVYADSALTVSLTWTPQDASSALSSVTFSPRLEEGVYIQSHTLTNLSTGETGNLSHITAGLYALDLILYNSGHDTKATVIAGIYQDSRLIQTKTSQPLSLKENSSTPVSLSFQVERLTEGTSLALFIWEDFMALRPLSQNWVFPAKRPSSPPYLMLPVHFSDMGTFRLQYEDGSFAGGTLLGTTGRDGASTQPASFTLTAAEAGEYTCWINSKNFDGDDRRFFNINVNGKPLEKNFGQTQITGYMWENGGKVTLKKGENLIKIIDTSGYYARFSAAYLTKGEESPPATLNESETEPVVPFLTTATPAAMMQDFRISTDHEGGNGILIKKFDNLVTFRPDLSDTASANWFYWNFFAQSGEDRMVTFQIEGEAPISPGGPVYSLNGENWFYLSQAALSNQFSFSFLKDTPVQFAFSIPYDTTHLNTFLDSLSRNPKVRLSALCTSTEGRTVPLISFGNPNAAQCIVLTGRHHCCEASASYMLEGEIAYYLAQMDPAVLERYCFYVIPMIDIDGVVNGDQGKDRMPHDHNRDYQAERYPEIKAIKAFFADKNPRVLIDHHSPFSTTANPYFYVFEEDREEIKKLSALLEQTTSEVSGQDAIRYNGENDHDAGPHYNMNCSGYFFLEKGAQLSTTIEFPYSGKSPVLYQPANMRAFGASFGKALERYILEYCM